MLASQRLQSVAFVEDGKLRSPFIGLSDFFRMPGLKAVTVLHCLAVLSLTATTANAVSVKLDTIFAGMDPNVGNQTIHTPNFSLEINGWLDSSGSVDSDLRAKGVTTVLTNVNPTLSINSSYGLGRIRVLDGLMTSAKFQYGIRGDQHQNPITGEVYGGFTGFVQSPYFGMATARTGSNSNGTSLNEGGVFYQFAGNQGQPTGPVELKPTFTHLMTNQVGKTFNDLRWTTGTSASNPSVPTRPGKSEIGDITLEIVPAKDILRGSVKRTFEDPHTFSLAFKPSLPGGQRVALDDLAAALGVDHFNWFQQVTHVPAGWLTTVFSPPIPNPTEIGGPAFQAMVQNRIPEKNLVGFVDAIPQMLTQEAQYAFSTDELDTNGARKGYAWNQDWVDTQLPYFNEESVPFFRSATVETPAGWHIAGRDRNGIEITSESTSTVRFFDAPNNPFLDVSNPNDYFGFRTELIGVREDGSIRFLNDDFPGTQLSFDWKSNTLVNFTNGGIFLAASQPHGELLGGGVFGVSNGLDGDYNTDGFVDAGDYTIWRDSFGQTGYGLAADGDGDRAITQSDYDLWKSSFLMQSGAANISLPVPEPSSLVVLLAGVTAATCVSRFWVSRGHVPSI